MTKAKQSGAFKGHRFPSEIISYPVWAYFRFPMSFRDVEYILYKRGVIVSYETIRSWVGKFGHQYAKVIRRDRPAPSDKWHLDEVAITIRGKSAVDSKGPSHRCKQRLPGSGRVDILVQSRRNKKAADRFFRKLFKQYGQPRVLVTDKLRSYGEVQIAPPCAMLSFRT